MRDSSLRLGRTSSFLFHLIALIIWSRACGTDRSTSRWKTKPTRKRKRKRSKKTSTSINKPYELTIHLPHSLATLDTLHRG